MRCQQRGFTLLELLVVLIIASAMAAIAAPSFEQLLSRVRFAQQGSELVSLLQQQAQHARHSGQPRQLTLEPGQILLDQQPLLHLPEGTTLQWQPDRPGAALTFFRDGSNSGGKIQLSNGQQQQQISLHWLTGEVKLDAHQT